MRYASALLAAKARFWGWRSIRPKDRHRDVREIPLYVVYSNLPAVTVDQRTKTTMETRGQADQVFERLIRRRCGKRKIDQKRAYFRALFHAAKLAIHYRGCIRYSRDRKIPGFVINMAVIEAAVESGLFHPLRSPKGSPKMSRLLALSPLQEFASADPWTIDPYRQRKLVFLRQREIRDPEKGGKKPPIDLPFDRKHPVAADVQRTLERCNKFISRYEITCQIFDEWDGSSGGRRQLRPVHYAVFTDNFERHGRIYTGKFGHQSLSPAERATIEFNGEPCIELDFGGMHCRLLYHRRGLPFDGDPYVLGEFGYDRAERYLAKTVINAAINAADPRAAISACNYKLQIYAKGKKRRDGTRGKKMKQGKALATARNLAQALEKTGTTFKQIYEMALKFHRPIREDFSSDAGMCLMRIDSKIALKIFSHFTERGIPCLCCHDSFLVPRSAKTELRQVMKAVYFAEMGFLPDVK